jgi:septal ring-binding cell division protein DamX
MSRPRKDLHELELSGAIAKNPQRYRDRIAQAETEVDLPPIGPSPERWNVPEAEVGGRKCTMLRSIWDEFAPQIPRGTPMKRALLEMFCESMYKFRTSGTYMKTSEKAYMLQLAKAIGQDGAVGAGKQDGGNGGPWTGFE